jgi:hypothetical protein
MKREFVAGAVGLLLVIGLVARCGAVPQPQAQQFGRYQIVAGAQGGIARIDTQTGQVWLIQGGDQGVAWQAVPQPSTP